MSGRVMNRVLPTQSTRNCNMEQDHDMAVSNLSKLRTHTIMTIASPARFRGSMFRGSSALQSPGDGCGSLVSPGFTLHSPFGAMPPMSSCSAIISPSMWDLHTAEQTNLSSDVESDFFDTFQISAVATNISSLISLNTDHEDEDELDDIDDDEDYDFQPNKAETAAGSSSFSVMSRRDATSATDRKTKEPRTFIASSFVSPLPTTMKAKSKSRKENDTPDEGMQCKCKKSQCLKLYCDCFASNKYCNPSCKCHDCMNSKDSENVNKYEDFEDPCSVVFLPFAPLFCSFARTLLNKFLKGNQPSLMRTTRQR